MTDLEKFLRQATRGLWGRERQTVRRELESHIRHRASRYELSGSSEVEAVKLAIADLGEAREINAGMNSVYNIPSGVRFGVLTAALTTLGFMTAQLGTAQVTGTTRWPVAACLEKNQNEFKINATTEDGKQIAFPLQCDTSEFFISLKRLRSTLEPLGVMFEARVSPLSSEVSIKFPEGETITLDTIINRESQSQQQTPTELLNGHVQAWKFFARLRSSKLPIRVEAWRTPRVSIGQTVFEFRSSNSEASLIYPALFSSDLSALHPGSLSEPLIVQAAGQRFFEHQSPDVHRFTHSITTQLEPGTVMAVLSQETVTAWMGSKKIRRAYLVPVAADGNITYPSASRTLAVVQAAQLGRSVKNGHATVTLVRFTGSLTFNNNPLEPVRPEDVKVISR